MVPGSFFPYPRIVLLYAQTNKEKGCIMHGIFQSTNGAQALICKDCSTVSLAEDRDDNVRCECGSEYIVVMFSVSVVFFRNKFINLQIESHGIC